MSENEITILKRKRGSIKAKLTHFTNYLNSLQNKYNNDNVEIEEHDFLNLESRCTQAYAIIEEFDEVQSKLESCVDEDEIDACYAEREQFSQTFYNQTSLGKRLLSKLNPINEKIGSDSSLFSENMTVNVL